MDRTERFYLMLDLLRRQRSVSAARFMEELEVSRATFKRDLEYLRDRLHAPIEYDRSSNGYVLVDEAGQYALPGFWLSSDEIHALLAAYELLSNAARGPLGEKLAPIRSRIESLLEDQGNTAGSVRERIRICEIGNRRSDERWFTRVANAVLSGTRLWLRYEVRAREEVTEREVSPLRLTHYRDNWYLDAWCHARDGLRSFALDAMQDVQPRDDAARQIDGETLDAYFRASYGIFSGAPVGTAVIRFSARMSRWVSREHWHHEQQGHFDEQQRWVLELPYAGSTELLMDVLHYGSDAEILDPPSLREQAKSLLALALSNYEH